MGDTAEAFPLTGGVITETEAYAGPGDRACHAYGNRRTRRTETMYSAGGVAYIYLCYGIHHLFNVVTNAAGKPFAVLIRALQPTHGLPAMKRRLGRPAGDSLGGPGVLTKALGIRTEYDGTDLTGNMIWIEDRGCRVSRDAIEEAPRIGVDYAGEDARHHWRFFTRQRE